MAILLNVPYSEKDQVKSLGAWWNPQIKKWYVKNGRDYIKFKKWIYPQPSFYIICNQIYIIEGERHCYKCGNKTRVISFGIDCYMDFDDTQYKNGYYYNNDEEIHIVPSIYPIPEKIIKYAQSQYNYKEKYSKFTESSYLANACDVCDALQGHHFLFGEVGSPFWIENIQDAAKLKIFRIPLEYDIVATDLEIHLSTTDYMLSEYGKIIDLTI